MGRQGLAGVSLVIAVTAFGSAFERTAAAQEGKPGGGRAVPVFEVDPNFPAMPSHMLLGGVGGATADSHGNVWVFHRPHTLEEDNATLNGYAPAPPVLEFSPTGRYLQGWGGPAKSGPYEWFNRGGLYSAFAECQSCKSERRRSGWLQSNLRSLEHRGRYERHRPVAVDQKLVAAVATALRAVSRNA